MRCQSFARYCAVLAYGVACLDSAEGHVLPRRNSSSLSSSTSDQLPLTPTITPALGIAGVFLIATGLAYASVGMRYRSLHVFLSATYLISLSVMVLIEYAMDPPVSNAVQGAFFVAACVGGIIAGGVATLFKDVTEGLGCLLGGFCFSMWLMTLRSGGLIHSRPGTVVFVIVLSALCFALFFVRRIKNYALITGISFSGATAVMLGIDCFTRAGLKEFWIYIWGVNSKTFPSGAKFSYPMTKSVRIEIGCTILMFVCGLIYQTRVWMAEKQRSNRTAAEWLQQRRNSDKMEAVVSRQNQEMTTRDQALWEIAYEDPEVRRLSKPDPGLGLPVPYHLKSPTVTVTTESLQPTDIVPPNTATSDEGSEEQGSSVGLRSVSDDSVRQLLVPRKASEPSQGHDLMMGGKDIAETNLTGDGEASLLLKPHHPTLSPTSHPPPPVFIGGAVPDNDNEEMDASIQIKSQGAAEDPQNEANHKADPSIQVEAVTPTSVNLQDVQRQENTTATDTNIKRTQVGGEEKDVRKTSASTLRSAGSQAQIASGMVASRRPSWEGSLPGFVSKVATNYRTNEWAKHLEEAEKPEVDQDLPTRPELPGVRVTYRGMGPTTDSSSIEMEQRWRDFDQTAGIEKAKMPKNKRTIPQSQPLTASPRPSYEQAATPPQYKSLNLRKPRGTPIAVNSALSQSTAPFHQRMTSLPPLNTTLLGQRQMILHTRFPSTSTTPGTTTPVSSHTRLSLDSPDADDMPLSTRRALLLQSQPQSQTPLSHRRAPSLPQSISTPTSILTPVARNRHASLPVPHLSVPNGPPLPRPTTTITPTTSSPLSTIQPQIPEPDTVARQRYLRQTWQAHPATLPAVPQADEQRRNAMLREREEARLRRVQRETRAREVESMISARMGGGGEIWNLHREKMAGLQREVGRKTGIL